MFAVKASHSATAYSVVSGLALLVNVAVLVFHMYKIVKFKRNPLKEEIYVDDAKYKEIAALK
jgi:hypothetical protein